MRENKYEAACLRGMRIILDRSAGTAAPAALWEGLRDEIRLMVPREFVSSVAHDHFKDGGLFGLPPPSPTGVSLTRDYYQLMASHHGSYGELLMQGGLATGAHLSDYMTPIDGESQTLTSSSLSLSPKKKTTKDCSSV